MEAFMWEVKPEHLKELDLNKSVELLIECFFEAQKETLRRAKKKLGWDDSDEAIRNSVETMVDMAFKKCDGDMNNPTLECFEKVLDYLAKKSESFGQPIDIIEHHKKQMEKILAECKKRCGRSGL